MRVMYYYSLSQWYIRTFNIYTFNLIHSTHTFHISLVGSFPFHHDMPIFYNKQDWKKYSSYDCKVDPSQNDKATEIKLCTFKRPHMRAFHCSWWSFFVAFFIWFAIAPLLTEVKETLGLTKQQIWTSNICSVAGTILMRFINGPLCDKIGARLLFGIVLMAASIPTALTG